MTVWRSNKTIPVKEPSSPPLSMYHNEDTICLLEMLGDAPLGPILDPLPSLADSYDYDECSACSGFSIKSLSFEEQKQRGTFADNNEHNSTLSSTLLPTKDEVHGELIMTTTPAIADEAREDGNSTMPFMSSFATSITESINDLMLCSGGLNSPTYCLPRSNGEIRQCCPSSALNCGGQCYSCLCASNENDSNNLINTEVEQVRRSIEAEIQTFMGSSSRAADELIANLRRFFTVSDDSTKKIVQSPKSLKKLMIRNRGAVLHAQAHRIRKLKQDLSRSFSPVMSFDDETVDTKLAAPRATSFSRSSLNLTYAVVHTRSADCTLLNNKATMRERRAKNRGRQCDYVSSSRKTSGTSSLIGSVLGTNSSPPIAASESNDGLYYDSDPGGFSDSDLSNSTPPATPPNSTNGDYSLCGHPSPRNNDTTPRRSGSGHVRAATEGEYRKQTLNSNFEKKTHHSKKKLSSPRRTKKQITVPSSPPLHRLGSVKSLLMTADLEAFDIYDDKLVSGFIRDLTSGYSSLVWHQNQTPIEQSQGSAAGSVKLAISAPSSCVQAWFEMGFRLRDLIVQPKFMWRPAYHPPDTTKTNKLLLMKDILKPQSVDLLNIVRIIVPNSIDRSLHPFAKLNNSFVVITNVSELYLFEAATKEERDRLVYGLKLVVARLASKIIVGDEGVFEEFFTPWGTLPKEMNMTDRALRRSDKLSSNPTDEDSEDFSFGIIDPISLTRSKTSDRGRQDNRTCLGFIHANVVEESERKEELWGPAAW